MRARIVMAHDDEAFVIAATVALRNAGYSIATFTDSMLALDIILEADSVELLITCMQFAPGKPNGVVLAQMGTIKHREMKVVFTGLPEHVKRAKGLGPILPVHVGMDRLVATVARLLGDAAER